MCRAPRDRNLNLGLGESAGGLTFYELPNHSVLSTFCADQADSYRAAGEKIVERSVGMTTLAQVCADHVRGPIHFLSIDVEGYERQVLQGADWARWRPAVVLVEATKPNTTIPTHQAWEPLLEHAEYRFAFFDGQNRFYVRAESPELLEACRGIFRETQDRLHEFERLNPSALRLARLLHGAAALPAARQVCLAAARTRMIAKPHHERSDWWGFRHSITPTNRCAHGVNFCNNLNVFICLLR